MIPSTALRNAFRGLIRRRRSFGVAALVLALGIGSGTAMFALMKVALLERLPYPEPDRLVQVWSTDRQMGVLEGGVSFDDYQAVAARARAAKHLAYSSFWFPTLTAGDGQRQIKVARASANLFETLGVSPNRGTTFTDRPVPVVVLGHRLHDRLFGTTDELPEAPVVLDGTPYAVVGVMPPGFSYPSDVEAWVPAAMRPATTAPARDGAIVGRLRPGAEIAALQPELEAIAATMAQLDPTWTGDQGLRAVALHQQVTAPVKNIVLLLAGAVGLFFLIACMSAAQLLFVENLGRRPDFAVRVALGARRGALRAQLFYEAALVAVLATAGGALLSAVLVEMAKSVIPRDLPRLTGLSISPVVLLIMLLLGALAALAVGLLSGWRLTDGDVATGLTGGLGGTRSKTTPARAVLTVTATAGIIVLTFGAVALALEMWKTTRADLGFEPEGVYTAKMCAPKGLPDPSRTDLRLAFGEIDEALPAVPAIRSVAIADGLPLGAFTTAETFIEGVEGYPEVRVRAVSSGYFDALRIPVVEGRTFPASVGEGEKVAVVNRAFGERFWPGRSALGQQFMGSWDDDREWITIVGVAGNVRRSAADDGQAPEAYIPFFQQNDDCGSLLVATDRGGSAGLVRDQLWSLNGRYDLSDVTALESLLLDQNWRPRLRAAVLGLFGVLALVFGAVALYTTLRQVVSSRQKELATRAALGATPAELAQSVLRGHAVPVGLGVVFGALASILGVRLVGASFHGIETIDGLALAIVCGLLALIALAAAAGPAIRSSRVDVMTALRAE